MRNRIAIVDIATRKFKALSYKQYDANNLLQMVILEAIRLKSLINLQISFMQNIQLY